MIDIYTRIRVKLIVKNEAKLRC